MFRVKLDPAGKAGIAVAEGPFAIAGAVLKDTPWGLIEKLSCEQPVTPLMSVALQLTFL